MLTNGIISFEQLGPGYSQQRLKLDGPAVQFDQSLHYLHDETLHPWLSVMCPVKILIWAQLFKASLA